ncbi:MAG: glutaredoxin domain-containing protein [Candidatus Nanoarchaeia archaeon]|nr:glutaredoxin domain-containing protein [Candidatus Nanoarchaeia archaeon]
MNFAKIEVYMRPTCKDSKEAISFLENEKIAHKVIDITTSEGYLLTKDMELSVLPTILLKDEQDNVVDSVFCVEGLKRALGR